MIEVASIGYGCQWGPDWRGRGWPLRIQFGAVGPEVTVDEMLEGRGHAVLQLDQLVALVRGMTGLDTPIKLARPAPAGLATMLVEAGFRVPEC
jgi:hypothetical protein